MTKQTVARPAVTPEYLSVPEGAALLRVSHWTIRAWLKNKKLPRYKAGGRTLASRDSLLALIREAE